MINFGFVKDEESLKFKEIFKDGLILKKIHIDIFPKNPLNDTIPFMLLLRATEKNVIVSNNEDRFILKKNDMFETYIMNILSSDILESFCEITDTYSEFILNIQDIYYRITILN